MKRILTLLIINFYLVGAYAQEQKTDTVIVPLARTSQIIFTIKDYADVETLKHYNFQALFDDILSKISQGQDTLQTSTPTAQAPAEEPEEDWSTRTRDNDEAGDHEAGDHDDEDDDDEDDDEDWDQRVRGRKRFGRTWQTINVDLGTNNLMENDQFVGDDKLYSVRPWGSWYVGINSVHRSRVAPKFFLEWSWGFSWYNFKFERDNVLITKDDNGVSFIEDTRDVDHVKSKLSASYINMSLVPMLDLGDRARKSRIWDSYGTQFRIGAGPYLGYRLASKSKIVYEEDGDRERDKERDRYYLNNLRYGIRLQLGVRSTDFFINYDLNELFENNKGPAVNAVSFGVIF